MNSLEDLIRSELRRDADNARFTCPEWDGAMVPVATSLQRPALYRHRSVALAAAALLVAVSAVVFARRDTNPIAADFTPPGREYVLVQGSITDLPVYNSTGIARPGSVVVASAPGVEGWLMTYDSASYSPLTGSVEAQRCSAFVPLNGGIGSGCSPIVETIDYAPWTDESGIDVLVGWTNLPAGTKVVGYVDNKGAQLWQRPVGRMAFFPSAGQSGTITAYSDDGSVLGEANSATRDQSFVDAYGPYPISSKLDSLTERQREELTVLAESSIRSCLDDAGAMYPNGQLLPELPVTAGPAVWEGCVAKAKRLVDARFSDLGGTLLEQPLSQPPTSRVPAATDLSSSSPVTTSVPATTR